MSDPRDSGRQPANATGTPPPGEATRILVAEDEDGTLSLQVTILTYSGFTVIAARDGLEAIELAREAPPDLALLDVMMPRMDGREVCRRMAADPALTHVPVILLSSADERDIDWRGCGAEAFLAKPFSIRELLEIVRRHLASRTASDPPRAHRLTDAEVRAIALRIRQAVRQPPEFNPRAGVLSPYRELSPDDESRVEAVLLDFLSRPETSAKRPPVKDAGARRKTRRPPPDDDNEQ